MRESSSSLLFLRYKTGDSEKAMFRMAWCIHDYPLWFSSLPSDRAREEHIVFEMHMLFEVGFEFANAGEKRTVRDACH